MQKGLKSVILHLRTFTLQGFFCWLSMKLNRKEVLVTGACLGCGTCCRSVSLEGTKGWIRSKQDFLDIVNKYPEYNRFSIVDKDSNGFLLFRCSWCTPEGHCKDHENRLPLCKNFPDKSLVFSGGQLPAHCGYTFNAVVPFKKVFDQELEKNNETSSNP